jgi:protein-S-isoprenylcysteine O-methyltransferase Ste14
MAAVYLWRTSAHRTSNSLSVNAIAVAASFLTVPLLVLNANVKSGMLLMLIGAIVGTAGLGFSIFSIYSLGKSFSIIPQAREFVHQGPYQYIRHPLYLGEIVSAAGFVLAHLSLTMLSILAMLFVMQAFRAVVEEKILAGTFPEYKTYMAKTWRFVPRVY